MSLRELIILLLGLAIVAVVLRGLYVAIQARRGQIRLAIDKNIPKDVDLDALEMSELPSGGARVRARSAAAAAADPALVRAKARAATMDLGDEQDEQVPVLMDAVELRASAAQAEDVAEEEFDDLPYDLRPDDSVVEDEEEDFADAIDEAVTRVDPVAAEDSDSWQEDDLVAGERPEPQFNESEYEPERVFVDDYDEAEDVENESADDVLFDYDVSGAANRQAANSREEAFEETDAAGDDADLGDGMAALAPDYRNEPVHDQTDEFDEDEYDDEYDESYEDDNDEHADEDRYYTDGEYADDEELADAEDADEFDDEYDDDSSDESDDALDDYDDARTPALGNVASFEDSLDSFSMSAGERIGGESQTGKSKSKDQSARATDERKPVQQSTLFDDDEPVEKVAKPGLRQALFSAFSRKKKDAVPAAKDKQDSEQAPAVAATEPPPQPRREPEPQSLFADDEKPVLKPVATAPPRQSEPAPEIEVQETRSRAAPAEPSEVLVINVMAREGYAFNGHDLLESLITSGLKFGDMNIFHMRSGPDGKGPAIFSVANMLNPGTFDLNNMEQFSTVGISLFLALPAPTNNLDAFEKMLTCARQVQMELSGEMKDDHRNVMTKQTIEHYRQRIRDFELRRLKAAGSRA